MPGRAKRSRSMNLALMVLIIAEVCLGICAWRSSQCLRCMAAHLLTKADVIDLSRESTRRRMLFWSHELGLDRHGFSLESGGRAEPESRLARRGTAG